MSFGPPVADGPAERGVVFIAYNASIAEQFEVVQRWINGGNSTGVASCQSDPIMGVAEAGNDRVFRFEHAGKPIRLKIPTPFVELMWGSYLFAPSMTALAAIAALPEAGTAPDPLAAAGERLIAELKALARHDAPAAAARWKVILEDFFAKDADEDAVAQTVWAAITARGGALRIPYPTSVLGEHYPGGTAVLVGDKALVLKIFENAKRRYSVDGYQQRLATSFGEIYLGEDIPPASKGSKVGIGTNTLLLGVEEKDAFAVARHVADTWLTGLFDRLEKLPPLKRAGKIDLKREYFAPVLAEICRYWFGIPDGSPVGTETPVPGAHVEAGAWDWRTLRSPRCPADFMSPSRFVFSPDPVPAVQAYGQQHGQRLRAAVRDLFAAQRAAGSFAGPFMPKMAAQIADDDLLARTVIGVMTGFLPPTDAALRWAVYDWTENHTLWRVQQRLIGQGTGGDALTRAKAIEPDLIRTMQKRPAPDLLWRTATKGHRLGKVRVRSGDRVIVGIAGATCADPAVDPMPIFGGDKDAHLAAGHPSHACPAYRFAMGTMLGILSALLERGRLEVLPAPLILKLTETTPPAAAPPPPGG